MDRSLFGFILRYSKRDQLLIVPLVLGTMVVYYLSLDLPKTIINQAIQGTSFPQPDAQVRWLGFELGRIEYLFALSLVFLGLIVAQGWLKFQINTMKGWMGERMLRRLRYALFDYILRFPLQRFRRVKAAEMATMIKDEVEPLGGFIGEAFITPLFLGGQALTAMAFILYQHVSLGMIALGIVAVQAWLIPRLRRRLLVLGRERQLTARALAGRIAESVDGVAEIHANDTSNYERAEISARLGHIFRIRFEFYQRKFLIKFLNNFLSQVTPFLFYAVGGYLVIVGSLDIGALVAVIAAYKDLPGPVKELIDWDQQRLDVQIKYEPGDRAVHRRGRRAARAAGADRVAGAAARGQAARHQPDARGRGRRQGDRQRLLRARPERAHRHRRAPGRRRRDRARAAPRAPRTRPRAAPSRWAASTSRARPRP